jgi:hypothetical protein
MLLQSRATIQMLIRCPNSLQRVSQSSWITPKRRTASTNYGEKTRREESLPKSQKAKEMHQKTPNPSGPNPLRRRSMVRCSPRRFID